MKDLNSTVTEEENKQNKNSESKKELERLAFKRIRLISLLYRKQRQLEESKKEIERLVKHIQALRNILKRVKPIYDKEKDVSYCPFCFDERKLERTDLNDFTHYPKCIYLQYDEEAKL